MRPLRFLRVLGTLACLSFLPLGGCPAPDPPKAPTVRPPSEEAAHEALEEAKAKGDVDALFAVHNKFEKFPSGKKALRLAVRKLLEEALELGEKCDLAKANGNLAAVAPYTADDAAINTAYDETKARVDGEGEHCALVKMDDDVKRAEQGWDWPRAFNRIATEKTVSDTKFLTKRRVELLGRYAKFLDDTLKMMVSKKSVSAVVDDKKEEWVDSTDPSKLPPEVGVELAKRADAIAGVMLVFDKLEGGQLVDPPIRHWTFGKARPRRTDSPGLVGTTEMANGISFMVVARGKVGDVTLLCWGQGEGTVLQRLASIKALVVDVDAKTYDTNTALPDQLVGARVLAPVAAGSDVLTPSVVLSAAPTGVIQVIPVSSSLKKLTTPKINTKKEQLRGLVLPPGTTVQVLAGGQWKKAEVAEAPEEDRVLVKINGFETPVSLGDVRVKRSDLPKAE
ncbi:MAG: hypothetical protein ABI175_06555 [Polyangiales bacterium]